MAQRTCLAIIDPRYDGECGSPAHLDTGRCIEHLPASPPPKVARSIRQEDVFDVGVWCPCLQRWEWSGVEAPSLRVAKERARPIIARLLVESADRWQLVGTLAREAGRVQRRRSRG